MLRLHVCNQLRYLNLQTIAGLSISYRIKTIALPKPHIEVTNAYETKKIYNIQNLLSKFITQNNAHRGVAAF